MLRRSSSKPKTDRQQQSASFFNTEKAMEKFIEFIETDLWTMPIAHFIEQNSIVFDREQSNPSVYERVHHKFVELVNTLIDSYCQDTGIDLAAFKKALEETLNKRMLYKERIALEPIVASRYFNVFVPMMMQKNIELQLQALKMFENLNGLVPSSLKMDDSDAELCKSLFVEDESERLILISVLRQSKSEWEEEQRIHESEYQQQLLTATRDSMRESGTSVSQSTAEVIEKYAEEPLNAVNNELTNLAINGHQTDCLEKSEISTDTLLQPTSESKEALEENYGLADGECYTTILNMDSDIDNKEGGENMLKYRSLLKGKNDNDSAVPEDLIRQRANYLREQRDKLIENKRQQRERQLQSSEAAFPSQRPRTAKAARDALFKAAKTDELQNRRAIIEKIKANIT